MQEDPKLGLRTPLAPLLICLAMAACSTPPEPAPAAGADGKIAISTESEEARELYLVGRDLSEKLRRTDAHGYFIRAIAADERFALAHLAAAINAPTNRQFFESLQRAVELADGASLGERLVIQAWDAQVRSDPSAQLDYLTQLVEAFPEDERAQNQLAAFYGGRQEFDRAIEHFKRATQINPEFSPPYNSLGYTYRAVGDYAAAEAAFERYIELIPDEPNPYDSYAELLMKTGRFEESIENYEKALELDPNFVFSFQGIANNLMFLGKFDEARGKLEELLQRSRSDAERRVALMWKAASHLHEGSPEKALAACGEAFTVAEEGGDGPAAAEILVAQGDILLESGSLDDAAEHYSEALATLERTSLQEELKARGRRTHIYHLARVAVAAGELDKARSLAADYAELVARRKVPFENRRRHELAGSIALADEDWAGAVAELEQADHQDPRVLYFLAQAHRGAGNTEQARDLAERAASFNGLHPNYPLVRSSAGELLADL